MDLSLIEKKYMATSSATKKAMWFKNLLHGLGFPKKDGTIIFTNNQGSLTLIKNIVHHKRIKHIDIQHHFVKEMMNAKEVSF
jgi:hypothetical protein